MGTNDSTRIGGLTGWTVRLRICGSGFGLGGKDPWKAWIGARALGWGWSWRLASDQCVVAWVVEWAAWATASGWMLFLTALAGYWSVPEALTPEAKL